MNPVSPSTLALLTLSMLKGVGPAALKKVAALPGFGDKPIEELAMSIPAIEKVVLESGAWAHAQEAAAQQVDEAQRHQTRILSALDAEYPQLLAATKDDPFILYVKGTLAEPVEQSVAVIGTREPTMHGQRIAARIAQFFVEQGWSIVSGLAVGCDAVAHQAALDAGGHTVAVLAHGLQMIAPTKNKKLAEDILSAGGALVSEYPFGQTVRSQQYVKRDRTQAGLAQGVVMIQSDVKGGSLYASRASLNYGRWLAVPYPTEKDRDRGEPKVQANLLIADGRDDQLMSLLRCSTSQLEKIIVLHSREDYFQLVRPPGEVGHNALLEQPGDSQLMSSESAGQTSSDANVNHASEASEVDTADSLQESGSKAIMPEASASLREPTPRRIVLDKNGLSGLTIKQVPSAGSHAFRKLASQVQDADSLVALSARLRYIQAQLDMLGGVYADCRDFIDKEHRLTIQFIVEDTLMQMKRAMGLLIRLKGDSQAVLDDPLTLTSMGMSHAPQQFELGYTAMPEPQADFLRGILDEFMGELLQPLGFSEEGDNLYSELGDADLRFDNLVDAFNTLITKILHV